MCMCQAYGKSAVPNTRGYCLVCGEAVDLVVASEDQEAREAARCPAFRPDHNGECLLCDEWADEHDEAAIELGKQLAAGLTEDRCQVCGQLIGIGIPALHLGLCEACSAAKEG